jgi:hypothetical protein
VRTKHKRRLKIGTFGNDSEGPEPGYTKADQENAFASKRAILGVYEPANLSLYEWSGVVITTLSTEYLRPATRDGGEDGVSHNICTK